MDNLPVQLETALTTDDVVRQTALIQEVLMKTMKKDVHYGIIPGCGDKPTLLKPGAEKICTTFRLSPTYDKERIDLPNAHREYEITCTLTHIPTGDVFGQGLGSCSTMESKFRYRNEERKCPKCGEPKIIKGKSEYGGGWLCWKKKGGCGAKFNDGDSQIENQEAGKVEYDNPADYYNTILKMAKKRAHVDSVLTAVGASDIFAQDLEDLRGALTPKTTSPKPEKPPEAKPSSGVSVGVITEQQEKAIIKLASKEPHNMTDKEALQIIERRADIKGEGLLSYDEAGWIIANFDKAFQEHMACIDSQQREPGDY